MILYRNMPKSKKMPGTKNQNKYLGPIIAQEVTDTHVIIKQENGSKKKKVPLNLSRVHHPRRNVTNDECEKNSSAIPLKDQRATKVLCSCINFK